MKAWVLEKPKHLALKDIPIPLIGDSQVLVRIDAACICNGSDPGIYHGHEAYQLPMVFGHEACGMIVEAGRNVKDFQVGDRVAWWFEAGAFAEYQSVTPENVAMFRVPDSVTVDEGPVLELVIAACRALMEVSPEEYGKRLTICGLGPSGLTLLQYARMLGFTHISGWDLFESRRNLALSLGIDEVHDPRDFVYDPSGKSGEADVAVDMMGNDVLEGEPTFTALLRSVRPGGLVISYGHPENGRRFSPYAFQSRDLKMRGPVNDIAVIREKGTAIMEAVMDGRIRIEPLITHVISFNDLDKAFANVLENPGDQIKVILKWDI